MWLRRVGSALFAVGLFLLLGPISTAFADPTNLVLAQDATSKLVTASWSSSAGDLTSAPVWDLTSDRSNFGHKVAAGAARTLTWTPDNDGLCGRTWLFTMTEREGSSQALTASVNVARVLFAPACPTGVQAGQVVTVGNFPTPVATVTVSNPVTSLAVTNFPTPVATFAVSNFPGVQPVTVNNFPSPATTGSPQPVTVVGPVDVQASAGVVLPVRETSPVPQATAVYNASYSTTLNCTASPDPSPSASPSPSPSPSSECAVSAKLAEGQPVVTTVVLILGTLLLLTTASFLVQHGKPWRV